MRFRLRINLNALLALVYLVVFTIMGYNELKRPSNCTIFTAVQGGTVLYGNNEDHHNKDHVIGIYPPSQNGFGSVHFGYRLPNGNINFEGAVNDQGLAWDTNSTPGAKMNPHPERPYYLGTENYLDKITNEAASVEDAIQLAKAFHFGDVMKTQIHIGDKSGDAVVISGGSDGEIAFTRKVPGDGYHLSTNFNLATNEGPVDFRWETASSMLDALDSEMTLTPSYAGEVLDAVRLNNLTTYTLYSSVLDLNNNKVYLFYMSQFDEMAEIDMEDEFSKGERVVDMRDYFSPETVTAGDAAYQKFENRFKAAQVSVIAAGVLLISGLIILVVRFVRKR
jgi:hypothetical protein